MASTYNEQPSNDITDFLAMCKKETNIDVLLYPSYSKFKWHHKDKVFNIEMKEDNKVKKTNEGITTLARLFIRNESLQNIKDFIYDAMNYVTLAEDTEKVRLFVNKCSQYGSFWDEFSSINVQTLDNIFIDKKVKENLISYIDKFVASGEKYERFGKIYKMNLLFSGIAGSGKTSLCKALAKNYGYSIYIMNFNKNMTDEFIIQLASDVKDKSIVLYEDIDAYFIDRTAKDVNVSFSCLINILDGTLSKGAGTINIITTNHPEKLDAAMLRSGRIDKIIKFDYPKKEEIRQAFNALIGTDQFEEFYENIKHRNINMSAIIDYFFKHPTDYLDKDNIKEFICQLQVVKSITREENTDKIYT